MITDIKYTKNSYKLTGKIFWPLFGCELKASINFFYDEENCNGEPLQFMFEFEGMEYPKSLDTPTNILPYIKPVKLYTDKEVAGCYSISAFLECAWEPNHGLQWVVRNGKPLYVGGFDGLGSHCDEYIYLENWKESNYLFVSKSIRLLANYQYTVTHFCGILIYIIAKINEVCLCWRYKDILMEMKFGHWKKFMQEKIKS